MPTKYQEKKSGLRSKYRLSICKDASHYELFVVRLSGLGMLISSILFIIIIMASVTFLIAFTSLREMIPGYPDTQTRRNIVSTALKADSLERVISRWDWYLSNVHRILNQEMPTDLDALFVAPTDSLGMIPSGRSVPSKEDSLLRVEVKEQEQFAISERTPSQHIDGTLFFSPVKGVVSDGFNVAKNHFAIDIAAPKNSVVNAVLDGTIIFSGWTDDTGFVIQVQHTNNLISFYKHNEKLLKTTGERVKAGDAIALVGNTGSITTGTHLHFELWHNGSPVDPTKYIAF
ncbi:MAG: M23 family metallopeptidase [Prevotellaceae bacterium]|jgi:murein DD-endopeptidase MepM/ murein hydrolase activator NlpD|nr:M23 family metallopeptidase [Prevotellaceae bacterium]